MNDIRKHRGMTLIEILVGLVIGMIATIVIFQVFAVSERQKRTTTGAADTQGNGTIGLFMIERDVKMAGWGLQHNAFASCTNLFTYNVATDAPLPNGGASLFASVAITDGDALPDTIAIQYYTNPSDEFRFAQTTLRETMPQPSSELKVNSPRGCAEGNAAIIADASNCTLMSITALNTSAGTLQHNPATANQRYNPGIPYQNTNGWPAYAKGATIQCFSDLYQRTYQINNNQLEVTEPSSGPIAGMQTLQVAPEIVDLQAEYGIEDTTAAPPIQWVPATGVWAAPNIANIRRIKAVRIALVARSSEYEKPEGAACETTTADMVSNWSSWASFDTSAYPADWQCYRYKVFEAVVPLRNIIWANL